MNVYAEKKSIRTSHKKPSEKIEDPEQVDLAK